jgi:hypothetical protein
MLDSGSADVYSGMRRKANDDIVAGRIAVVDYRQANSCPVQ